MWNTYLTVKYKISDGFVLKENLAIFDLENTLIHCASGGNLRRTNKHGWLFGPGVVKKLKDLSKEWSIVIISNEDNYLPMHEERNELILKEIDIPIIIMVATCNDIFKKPNLGCLSLLFYLTKSSKSHIKKSFFCGDSCGNDDPYPPYRSSDDDIKFAKNAEIAFYRPMDIFERVIPEIFTPSNFNPNKRELVILVGNPRSGKSTIAKRFSKTYKVLSQESHQKILKLLAETIDANFNVIIDSTNQSKEKRKSYIALARSAHYHTRIIWCICDGRHFNQENKTPHVAYSVYSRYFERPSENEVDILEII